MPTKDMKEKLELAEDVVFGVLDERPNLTGQQVLTEIRRLIQRIDATSVHAPCRHCGEPITQTRAGGQWHHTDPDRSRGCRAATFEPDGDGPGWDNSLPRSATDGMAQQLDRTTASPLPTVRSGASASERKDMTARDGLERLQIAEGVVNELLTGMDQLLAHDGGGEPVAKDLLKLIRWLIERMNALTAHAVCRHCGKEIAQLHEESSWFHADPARSRGCRAASFTDANGWDEQLSANAVAAPPKGWRPS